MIGRQIKALLDQAESLKAADESEQRMSRLDDWFAEPQFKRDMSMGVGGLGGSVDDDPRGWGGGYGRAGYARQVKAFTSFLRDGKSGSAFELAVETKADLVENATGQNLVPDDYAGTIVKAIARRGVIRNLAYVRPTTKNIVDIGNLVINTAGWGKLETGTTPQTGSEPRRGATRSRSGISTRSPRSASTSSRTTTRISPTSSGRRSR